MASGMKPVTIRMSLTAWEAAAAEADKDGISVAQFVREAAMMRVVRRQMGRGEHPAELDMKLREIVLRTWAI